MPKLKPVTSEDLQRLLHCAQDVQADAADIAHRLEAAFSATGVVEPAQRATDFYAAADALMQVARQCGFRAALAEQRATLLAGSQTAVTAGKSGAES